MEIFQIIDAAEKFDITEELLRELEKRLENTGQVIINYVDLNKAYNI